MELWCCVGLVKKGASVLDELLNGPTCLYPRFLVLFLYRIEFRRTQD
jgi:hypothetical protein